MGVLADQGGDDTYLGEGRGSNGGASWLGIGFLDDAAGNDTYQAGGWGTNGGARGAFGRLVDHAGDDRYLADGDGANGGALGVSTCTSLVCRIPVPVGSGLLLDLGGSDHYEDAEGGSGDDVTVPLKGLFGAQVDVPS